MKWQHAMRSSKKKLFGIFVGHLWWMYRCFFFFSGVLVSMFMQRTGWCAHSQHSRFIEYHFGGWCSHRVQSLRALQHRNQIDTSDWWKHPSGLCMSRECLANGLRVHIKHYVGPVITSSVEIPKRNRKNVREPRALSEIRSICTHNRYYYYFCLW